MTEVRRTPPHGTMPAKRRARFGPRGDLIGTAGYRAF